MAFPRSAEELVLLRMLQGAVTGVFGAANALVAASVPRIKSGFAMGLMQVSKLIGFSEEVNYHKKEEVTTSMVADTSIPEWLVGLSKPENN